MLDAGHLADVLTDRLGVPLIGEAADVEAGKRVRFRPRDVPVTQGFTVEVLVGWRTVEAEFAPASYAASLVAAMESASREQRVIFSTFIRASIADGAQFTFRINEELVDPMALHAWPTGWRSVHFGLQKGPMVIDASAPFAIDGLVVLWGGRMLGAALSLLPLEPIEQPPLGEREGGGTQVLVTRYERSYINRAACIEIHGTICAVCGFEFSRVYGPIGEGFIEVHHLEMVSSLAPGTVLDPARDLVPVCANCHAMFHRRTPPYSIEELRAFLTRATQGQ